MLGASCSRVGPLCPRVLCARSSVALGSVPGGSSVLRSWVRARWSVAAVCSRVGSVPDGPSPLCAAELVGRRPREFFELGAVLGPQSWSVLCLRSVACTRGPEFIARGPESLLEVRA